MYDIFGSSTTIERTAQCWLKIFRSDDEILEDDERSGQPFDVDSNQLRVIVNGNPRIAIFESLL